MATDMKLALVLQLRNELTAGLQGANSQLKGLQQTVKDTQASFAANYGEIANASKMAGAAIAGAGVAIAGSLTAAAMSAAKFGDDLYEMSQRTGMTTETLSALKYAADQTGASMGNVEMAVKTLSRAAMEALNSDTGEAARAFKMLGISLTDASGKTKSTETLFMEIGEALRGVKSDTERAAIASTLLGRGGMKLIPMFIDAKNSMSGFVEEAKRLGLVVDETTAKSLGDFNDSVDRLKSQGQMAFVSLGATVIPILNVIVAFLSWGTAKLQEFRAEHPLLAGVAGFAAMALAGLLVPLGTLLYVLPTVVQGVNILRAALTAQSIAAVGAKLNMAAVAIETKLAGAAATVASGGFSALAASMWSAAWPVLVVVASILSLIGQIRLLVKLFDDIKNHRWGEALKDAGKMAVFSIGEGIAQIADWYKTVRGMAGGGGTGESEADYIKRRQAEFNGGGANGAAPRTDYVAEAKSEAEKMMREATSAAATTFAAPAAMATATAAAPTNVNLTITVDARGATDPAAVRQSAQAGAGAGARALLQRNEIRRFLQKNGMAVGEPA